MMLVGCANCGWDYTKPGQCICKNMAASQASPTNPPLDPIKKSVLDAVPLFLPEFLDARGNVDQLTNFLNSDIMARM